MEHKGKSIQDEIHEIISIQESDTPDDGSLSTNELDQAVSDFEMFAEQLTLIPHFSRTLIRICVS